MARNKLLVLGCGAVLATALSVSLFAAPDGQRGEKGPGGQRPGGQRGPAGLPEFRAVEHLDLTDAEQEKVTPILAEYRKKQEKLREDFLAELTKVLTPEQVQEVIESAKRRPPPPPQDGCAERGGDRGGERNGPPPEQNGR